MAGFNKPTGFGPAGINPAAGPISPSTIPGNTPTGFNPAPATPQTDPAIEALKQALAGKNAGSRADMLERRANIVSPGKSSLFTGPFDAWLGQNEREKEKEAALKQQAAEKAETMANRTKQAKAVASLVMAQYGDQKKADAAYELIMSGGTVDLGDLAPPTGPDLSKTTDRITKLIDGKPYSVLVDKATGQIVSKTQTEEEMTPEDLRKSLKPHTDNYKEIASTMDTIDSLTTNPSAAGDMGLLKTYFMMLEPGGRVTDEEFRAAAEAGSLPQAVQGKMSQLLTGKPLDPTIRQDYIDQSRGMFGAAQSRYVDEVNKHRAQAEKFNYDPERIFMTATVNDAAPAPAADGGGNTLPTVTNRAEFDALAAGDRYLGPDGKERVK